MAPRKKIPVAEQENKMIPDTDQNNKEIPTAEQRGKDKPDTDMPNKKKPNPNMKARELPMVGNPENTVMIGGAPCEIKPTKLKYQRNQTAAFYHILEVYPLTDILSTDVGQFGDDRDGDKCVMDWLIAATDNEQLILDNYDDIDTGTIEAILAIFKRVNKIDEKESKLKNMEKARKGME